jgi:hypothetical protein
LHTQIESNILPELVAAFDCWKDNHKSSDEESEKENNAPLNPITIAAAAIVKTALDSLRVETKLQSFIDKLDQKLVEDWNVRKHDAEDAARSLKCSGSSVGLSDMSRYAPYARNTTGSGNHTQMPQSSSSTSSSRLPKLTDRERKYLETYNSCKKCQGFYMPENHACEFPSSNGYVEHMMLSVNNACK